jgi:hypothetical protein
MTFQVELRHSECSEGSCHTVLRIDGRCYADTSYQAGRAFDCALDDDTILAQYRDSQRPPPVLDCSDPAAANGGVCVTAEPVPDDCVDRPADEWQGNRVCGPYPPCERSDHCGIALACLAGLCRACTQDEDCAAGEGCALDHCMPTQQIACRTRRECADGSLCILSGITGGTARGNEDMRAYCLSPNGGASRRP